MSKDDFIRIDHIKHYGLVELVRASKRFEYEDMNRRIDNILSSNNKRKNARGRLRARHVLMVLLAGNFTCIYCREYKGLSITIDHVKSIGKGGRNDCWNIAPACANCNNKKGDMLLSEWSEMIGKTKADIERKIRHIHIKLQIYIDRDKAIEAEMNEFIASLDKF